MHHTRYPTISNRLRPQCPTLSYFVHGVNLTDGPVLFSTWRKYRLRKIPSVSPAIDCFGADTESDGNGFTVHERILHRPNPLSILEVGNVAHAKVQSLVPDGIIIALRDGLGNRGYRPSYPFCDLRDDRVSDSPKSVHPGGNPISHSTHAGFSEPPAALFSITSFKGLEFRSCVAFDVRPPL